jgi:hypothetical protein
MRWDELRTGNPAASSPRFCPGCRVPLRGVDDERPCRECGERPQRQGFCPVCDTYWLLPPGADCPKHDLPLEAGRPAQEPALPPGVPADWVTLARFGTALAAEARRIRLEAEGIPTALDGERMGDRSLYQVATGGVKLQVPRALAQEARILLGQTWASPDADDRDDAYEDLAPEPGAFRRRWMKGIIILLLGWPAAIGVVLALAAAFSALFGSK